MNSSNFKKFVITFLVCNFVLFCFFAHAEPQHRVTWEPVDAVDSYRIYVNNDRVATTSETSVLLDLNQVQGAVEIFATSVKNNIESAASAKVVLPNPPTDIRILLEFTPTQ